MRRDRTTRYVCFDVALFFGFLKRFSSFPSRHSCLRLEVKYGRLLPKELTFKGAKPLVFGGLQGFNGRVSLDFHLVRDLLAGGSASDKSLRRADLEISL